MKTYSRATFSDSRIFRYELWRIWNEKAPMNCPDCGQQWDVDSCARCAGNPVPEGFCMFIGLNPSTADEKDDDPTIRRCIRFAQDWGYDAMCMTNLFALRSTDPKKLYGYKKPEDIIGPENDATLLRLAAAADIVVCAWGTHGMLHLRDEQVVKSLHNIGAKLRALKFNGDGTPGHPLYLPSSSKPLLFRLP